MLSQNSYMLVDLEENESNFASFKGTEVPKVASNKTTPSEDRRRKEIGSTHIHHRDFLTSSQQNNEVLQCTNSDISSFLQMLHLRVNRIEFAKKFLNEYSRSTVAELIRVNKDYRHSIDSFPNFKNDLTRAVESYIAANIHDSVLQSLAEFHMTKQTKLDQMMQSLDTITLEGLGVTSDFFKSDFTEAINELVQLDSYITPYEILDGIRKTIDFSTSALSDCSLEAHITSEDLVQSLVYVIVKARPKQIFAKIEFANFSDVFHLPEFRTSLTHFQDALSSLLDKTRYLYGWGFLPNFSLTCLPSIIESLAGHVISSVSSLHDGVVILTKKKQVFVSPSLVWDAASKLVTTGTVKQFTHIPPLVNVTSVVAGGAFAVALSRSFSKTDKVYTWGANDDGQLGLGDKVSSYIYVQEPTLVPVCWSSETVLQISCGLTHCVLLTGQMEVWTWGKGKDGRLGHGDSENRHTPGKVKFPGSHFIPIINIACGSAFTLCAPDKGLYCFGKNDYYQLGLGHNQHQYSPVLIPTLNSVSVKLLDGGFNHAFVYSDQGSFVWGSNESGQLGLNDQITRILPANLDFPVEVPLRKIVCGSFHSLALTVTGQVFTWGEGKSGQLGHGDAEDRLVPTLVTGLPGICTTIAAGFRVSFAVVESHLVALNV